MKFRQSKFDEALDALSRAAKADPKNPEIQNFLGLTLSEKGMRTAAETAFRRAILLKPDYGGAQNNLAVFYLTQQPPSIELARWHYEKGGYRRRFSGESRDGKNAERNQDRRFEPLEPIS